VLDVQPCCGASAAVLRVLDVQPCCGASAAVRHHYRSSDAHITEHAS